MPECPSTYPSGNCLGPGFTETIPDQQEWSKYSTTILEPGSVVIYSSLSFACNGTLQLLTIPSEVRGSVYKNVNQYLDILVSVWRFNETGYYRVGGEFRGGAKTPPRTGYIRQQQERVYRVLNGKEVLWSNVTIDRRLEVLARDILGFRLLYPYNVDNSRERVYQHLPLLFKSGPSPGTFIPIVSVKLVASSGPVSGEVEQYMNKLNTSSLRWLVETR